ncbi:MAG: DcrB-related protein [Pyrinomonadaceae bacterium]
MLDFVHNDFTIGFPARWIDSSLVVLAGPPNDGYSPNITISREKLNFNLTTAEYAASQLVALREGLADQHYEVLEETPLTLGDMSAFERVHKFDVAEDNLRIIQLQVYLVKSNEALTITCTNLSDWFDRTKPHFRDAIRQFRWHGAQSTR